jgi:15-cis-phytoene synthase
MSGVKVSEKVTRKSASNLAPAFALLPDQKRQAMCALYAFCREVDDVADNEDIPAQERKKELKNWRQDIRDACENKNVTKPIVRELKPFIQQFHLPCKHFEALIDGMEMDLSKNRYDTWEELANYCYHVASVVGLLSLKVFECSHSNIPTYGYHLGQALQLTNILRDIHSDAAKNRIYVPRELLDKHGVSEADILSGKFSIQFRKVAQELAERAKYHYQQTSEHVPSEERSAMVASEMMAAVYWRILRKIEKQDFQVLRKDKTKLSKFQKLTLIARSFLRHWLRVGHSDYG